MVINERLRDSRLFVLDLDGVLYLNDTLIDKSDIAVEILRKNGKKVVFLTNNSGKPKSAVCEKLNRLGIGCVPEEVYTSVDIAVRYMKKQGYRRVFHVGTQAIKQQLSDEGFEICGPDEAECMLVGFKKDLSYDDVAQAIVALRREIPFIACNRDPYFPAEDGRFLPGCNFTVSAIEGCYNKKVDAVVGKPNAYFLDKLFCDFGISEDEISIVGDLYDADIKMAESIGVPAVWIGGTEDRENVVCAERLYDFAVTYFGES